MFIVDNILMDYNNAKKKILLIDDNEIILGVANAILSDEYEVALEKSGKDALNFIKNDYKPDLILLDILMPDMDGWETFEKIREISSMKGVAVAFLTSIHDKEAVKRSVEMGAADFITKPFDKIDLQNRVKKILEAKR